MFPVWSHMPWLQTWRVYLICCRKTQIYSQCQYLQMPDLNGFAWSSQTTWDKIFQLSVKNLSFGKSQNGRSESDCRKELWFTGTLPDPSSPDPRSQIPDPRSLLQNPFLHMDAELAPKCPHGHSVPQETDLSNSSLGPTQMPREL